MPFPTPGAPTKIIRAAFDNLILTFCTMNRCNITTKMVVGAVYLNSLRPSPSRVVIRIKYACTWQVSAVDSKAKPFAVRD